MTKAIDTDNRLKEEIEKELFLAVEAYARTNTKIPAGSSAIRKINGTWIGVVNQAGVEDYPVVITLAGENDGTIDYPSYKCGGDMKYLETKAEKLIFNEILTRGTDECEPGGRIEIEFVDRGNLKWVWLRFDGQIVASARLTKK